MSQKRFLSPFQKDPEGCLRRILGVVKNDSGAGLRWILAAFSERFWNLSQKDSKDRPRTILENTLRRILGLCHKVYGVCLRRIFEGSLRRVLGVANNDSGACPKIIQEYYPEGIWAPKGYWSPS